MTAELAKNSRNVCSSFTFGAFSVIAFLLLMQPATAISTGITDNTCTFKNQGKLFTLTMMNRYEDGDFYTKAVDSNTLIVFNFCDPFVPKQCTGPLYEQQVEAYSFLVTKDKDTGLNSCTPYSSDSKTSYFAPSYNNENNDIKLFLTMTEKTANVSSYRSTDFVLECSKAETQTLGNVRVEPPTLQKLVIYGSSMYACPVFEISSIWSALTDNLLIFGFILFVVGFIMLFYGILMTHLMIFLAAYFLSFAVLFGIFTAFLSPYSSTIAIYFSLLVILFLSTLIAYSLTRLVNVSVFFIGAFFGFIVAAIVNSIFCKITGWYSIWSLVVLQLVFVIRFGLLTFKYSEEVIVMSTSLVGSYMIIRPISWIFGGFPNQFTLYLMVENGEMKTLPWTFFLYLTFIIAVAILGAFYQILKLKRKKPGHQIQSNFMTQNVQEHLDRIKDAVDNIIKKISVDNRTEEDYKKMNEMEEVKNANNFEIQFQEPEKTKERKSKEDHF